MKLLSILLIVIVVVFVAIQLFFIFGQRNIETYPYIVQKKYDRFEIRKYEARLFTKVQLNTNDYSQASSAGFSKLAGYIFGGNDSKQKIAMTSPVAMGLEDSMTMMFMVLLLRLPKCWLKTASTCALAPSTPSILPSRWTRRLRRLLPTI